MIKRQGRKSVSVPPCLCGEIPKFRCR
jgi:hypothetical protein